MDDQWANIVPSIVFFFFINKLPSGRIKRPPSIVKKSDTQFAKL